ncbi:retrovirus-related Pol polyprotein from transposon opus [Nephila pilipes]|uniref:Retrovirus-related Pol polyprotein from transposon opus n=1 Tax=Nephila pilipes TaxID=299642 RepID=A0A8X6NB75_NEPPI|nr:retrovirus-related Pol polyprotein from transposon opus [Nephila pilipes]
MNFQKTHERSKYSFYWEGLRTDVKKFCESYKECQLTRSVRINNRSPITPVARPKLPLQAVNLDSIGPIDPPSSKEHKYILCLLDQKTRGGGRGCALDHCGACKNLAPAPGSRYGDLTAVQVHRRGPGNDGGCIFRKPTESVAIDLFFL